jgi:hypothetical protein
MFWSILYHGSASSESLKLEMYHIASGYAGQVLLNRAVGVPAFGFNRQPPADLTYFSLECLGDPAAPGQGWKGCGRKKEGLSLHKSERELCRAGNTHPTNWGRTHPFPDPHVRWCGRGGVVRFRRVVVLQAQSTPARS